MPAVESSLPPSFHPVLPPPLLSSSYRSQVLLLEFPSSWVTLSGWDLGPRVLMRQPQPPPHPPEAGLVGPQDLPPPVYLSRLLPSRLGPVSAFARESTQYKGGGALKTWGAGPDNRCIVGPEVAGAGPRLHSSRRADWRQLVMSPLWGISPPGSGQNCLGSRKGEDARDTSQGSSRMPRLALGPIL